MGEVGEVTASTLSKDQDVIDMESEEKRGTTDYSKLEEQIAEHKASAQKAGCFPVHLVCSAMLGMASVRSSLDNAMPSTSQRV